MFKFISLIPRLDNIKRYGTHLVNHPQTVSQHSFSVAQLALFIARMDNAKLSIEKLLCQCLAHDIPEVWLNDMPAPVKHMDPQINKKFHELEAKCAKPILAELPPKVAAHYRKEMLTPKAGREGQLVDLCDMLDRLSYLSRERQSGNSFMEDMYSDTLALAKTAKYKKLFKIYPTAQKLFDYFKAKVVS